MFGIRPFAYVHQPGKLFAFASFPKALHGSGIVPKKIDEDALARRMVVCISQRRLPCRGHQSPSARTFPGSIARRHFSNALLATRPRRDWDTKRCSPEQAARELRRLVDEAVNCRLPRNGRDRRAFERRARFSAIAVLAARQLREEGRALARLFVPRPTA